MRTKRTLLLFLPFALLIVSLSVLIQKTEKKYVALRIQNEELSKTIIASSQVTLLVDNIFADIRLASLHQVDNEKAVDHWKEEWIPLVRVKPWYNQIRWFDETGQERLRVNCKNGQPVVVAQDKLQNKKGRYYFDDCLKLDRDELFASPLDLNIEKDTIQRPFLPMLRVGTPVFSSKNEKRGIVMINYDASHLIKKLESLQNVGLQLLNSDGYWLKSTNPADEWGFMLEKVENTLAKRSPEVWQEMKRRDNGVIETPQGLWTFQKVFPLHEKVVSTNGSSEAYARSSHDVSVDEYHWIVASFLPDSVYHATTKRTFFILLIASFILLPLILILAWYVAGIQLKEKELKESLKANVTELSLLNEDLIVARDEAENATRAKSIFLANMSHEIRTPLNAVIGFSELVSADMVDLKQKNRLAVIKSAGGSLLRLINDILDLSKVEAHSMEIVPVVCDIPETLREIVSMFQITAEHKNITLQLEVGSIHLPTLWIDDSHLRQTVVNLISNAIKFTEKGGVRVVVNHDSQTSTLTIQVCDTGAGIPADQQVLIFESFRQTQGQSRSKFGGTGLGLSISKKLIELMGGTLTVTSELGIGTSFTIAIPAPEATQVEKNESRGHEWHNRRFIGQSVLVVDDNDHNRQYLEELFAVCNLTYCGASSGTEAIEICQNSHFDLILLDIRMPDLSGIEVFKKLKLLNIQQGVPIIALTASATAEEKEEIGRIGFAKYISKPIEPSRLVEELAAWLNFHTVEKVVTQESSIALTELQRGELSEVESLVGSLAEATAPIDFTEIETIATKLKTICSIPEILAFADQIQDNLQAFDISELAGSAHALTELCKKLNREVQHG